MLFTIIITVLIGAEVSAAAATQQQWCTHGVCVPAQLCVNNTLLSGGEGLLDVR